MKRLNRKGFTLIELLAVVVVMAVILVVTIPSVLSTMANARQKQLQNAADATQEWFTKQRELAIMGESLGSGTVDAAYTSFAISTTEKVLTSAVLVAAGLSDPGTNFDLTDKTKSSAYIKGNKICVKLTASSTGSLYNNAASGLSDKNTVTSSGCK